MRSRAIRWSGARTIRATVVGAGAHSMEVSGSTIFYREVAFPLKKFARPPSEPGGGRMQPPWRRPSAGS
ncbi:MAG: ethanolamine ammonia-lyase reactivating factor EutA [Intestinimonas sp.]